MVGPRQTFSAPRHFDATVARATVASARRGILRSMNVAERLRQDLADARRRGETFESAWTLALKRATAGQRRDERALWRAALADTREAWLAAWERRPASVPERALLAVALDDDRDALQPAAIHSMRTAA